MKSFLLLCLLSCVISIASASSPLALSDQQINLLKSHYPENEPASILWQGDPITITLPINQEKRLIFSEPIQADLNAQLTTAQLRVINNEHSLYLTAQSSFPTTRMYVTLKNSHEMILLDVSTTTEASNSTQVITVKPKHHSPDHEENNIYSADHFVNAIRFAWQQLYAPEGVQHENLTFERTPMHSSSWVNGLIYGNGVLAHPIASWKANGLYVTAVELRNQYAHPARIQLSKDICGHWRAAVLYPRKILQPVGNVSGDSTTLFLLSNQPLGESMQVCHGDA